MPFFNIFFWSKKRHLFLNFFFLTSRYISAGALIYELFVVVSGEGVRENSKHNGLVSFGLVNVVDAGLYRIWTARDLGNPNPALFLGKGWQGEFLMKCFVARSDCSF